MFKTTFKFTRILKYTPETLHCIPLCHGIQFRFHWFSKKSQTAIEKKFTAYNPTPNVIIKSKPPNFIVDLIRAINQIQDVFNTLNVPNSIQLPQIVMLGSQSAGKSSVLESIVHRSFLPRGTGIVTRCPLVLQLIECKPNDERYRSDANGTTQVEEWGEFLHDKDKIFTDFDEIRGEIERQTDELAGANKGICETPINLKIYSPHVVNLTLVDLPGITKVPVGDQPEDIEDQINRLVMKYIENPNSIILSVSAANADIATSESLKYAKQVDPEGLRTLAILTKIDLMDHGTDAWDMLNGNIIPVKLGIIGCINRSQKDINENKTIDEQLEFEKEFFDQHYKEIAHKNGIPYLSKRLSNLLVHHISECFPKLKQEIANKMAEYQKIYNSCGEGLEDREKIIFRLITELTKNFSGLIDGTLLEKQKNEKNIIGGPKIRKIFDEVFFEHLNKIEPELSSNDIEEYILNTGGPRPSIFGFEVLFQNLVNEEIKRLRVPSINCVDNIFDEMKNVIMTLINEQHDLARFPNLERKVQNILMQFLFNRLPLVKDSVNELIDIELSSVNTNHPDFSIEGILGINENQNSNSLIKKFTQQNFKSNKIELDAVKIRELIKIYFPIVRKSVQDLVPKIIMYKLIKFMKENIEFELLHQLYKENGDLLDESEDTKIQREKASAMIEALEAAKQAMDQIEKNY